LDLLPCMRWMKTGKFENQPPASAAHSPQFHSVSARHLLFPLPSSFPWLLASASSASPCPGLVGKPLSPHCPGMVAALCVRCHSPQPLACYPSCHKPFAGCRPLPCPSPSCVLGSCAQRKGKKKKSLSHQKVLPQSSQDKAASS